MPDLTTTDADVETGQDRKLRASMPVTMQMHKSRDLSLTPSCLEEDNDRQECVEKLANYALSQGSVEYETKNSVTCSSRVSQIGIKGSPAAWLPLEVSVPNGIENFDNESVMSKHSLDPLMQILNVTINQRWQKKPLMSLSTVDPHTIQVSKTIHAGDGSHF